MNEKIKNLEPSFWQDAVFPMLRQELRKIKATAGHAFTTTIATAVVLALFAYIFGDFFKEKLPEVNQEIAQKALFHLVTATLIVASLVISQQVAAKIRDPENWLGLLGFWGVNHSVITRFRKTIAAIVNFFSLLIVSYLLDQFFGPLAYWQWLLTPMLTIIAVSRFDFSKAFTAKDGDKVSHSVLDDQLPPLIAWRKSRIAQNNWSGSSLRIVSVLPILFGTIAILMGQRIEVSYLSSLLAGILLSWMVPFLIDDDLQTTWIERQAAVSHAEWIAAWQRIFTKWALRTFAVTTIAYTIVSIVGPLLHPAEPINLAVIWKIILTNSLLTAFPVWMAPAFAMQIDGKKPVTNIIMLTLIGIFAGSVVIAAPIAAPALILLHREAHRYQGGRFARGAYR